MRPAHARNQPAMQRSEAGQWVGSVASNSTRLRAYCSIDEFGGRVGERCIRQEQRTKAATAAVEQR